MTSAPTVFPFLLQQNRVRMGSPQGNALRLASDSDVDLEPFGGSNRQHLFQLSGFAGAVRASLSRPRGPADEPRTVAGSTAQLSPGSSSLQSAGNQPKPVSQRNPAAETMHGGHPSGGAQGVIALSGARHSCGMASADWVQPPPHRL